MRVRLLGAAVTIAALLTTVSPALAVDLGAQVYQDRCQSCHGEGGEGIGSFPALAGNPKMSDRGFVQSTVEQGAAGMPGFGHLPEAEIDGLVDYLVTTFAGAPGTDGAGGNEAAGGSTGFTPTTASLPPGDATRGEHYFLGKSRLVNGGAACVGCHAAGNAGGLGGGSLAVDLTGVSQKFGGEAAVAGTLADPAFPVMRASYQNKPLTDPERADLAAFFAAVASGEAAEDRAFPRHFWLISLLGTAVLFILMGLLWPRRGTSPAQRIRKGQ